MIDEHYPDRSGPPREVHEDAAARERSMTAEARAKELAWKLSGTTMCGHDDFLQKVQSFATTALHDHAEQARAEEQERCADRFHKE